MTIPAFKSWICRNSKYLLQFTKTQRKISPRIRPKRAFLLTELSMGMSGDFEKLSCLNIEGKKLSISATKSMHGHALGGAE